MRQIVLTPAGKTVLKTSVFVALVSFVIGVLTIMLMDDKGLGFVPAVLASIGIVVASVLALVVGIVAVCVIIVVVKERYDKWYLCRGFRKDLEKITKTKRKKTTKKTTKKTSKKKSSK